MSTILRRAALAAALCAVLAGCAARLPRAADADINTLLTERGGPSVDWSSTAAPESERAAITSWLSAPMSAESAVAVAMLRSPRLQLAYARLGVERAEVLEAAQISNPHLSFAREYVDPGSGYNRLSGIGMPLADLILLPAKLRFANAERERAKLEIANAVMQVAADVEAAWYAAVGAQQIADMRSELATASLTAAELALRFHDAGNISELQLKLEQAASSEARIAAAQARAQAGLARLALTELIGLTGPDTDWATVDRLPLPVDAEDDPELLVELARGNNLELLAANLQASILSDALARTRRFGWLGSTQIGYSRETDTDGSRLRGPTLDLELPIFHQGQSRVARAQAVLAESRARERIARMSAESAVRLGAQAVREWREVIQIYRGGLIPQREKIVERSQQEQNFMLIGVFELLQAKVREYEAWQGYLEAIRDYWIARTQLMRAVGQRLPSDAGAVPASAPAVRDIVQPAGEQATHDHHDHHGQHDGAMKEAVKEPDSKPAEAPAPHHDHSEHGDDR